MSEKQSWWDRHGVPLFFTVLVVVIVAVVANEVKFVQLQECQEEECVVVSFDSGPWLEVLVLSTSDLSQTVFYEDIHFMVQVEDVNRIYSMRELQEDDIMASLGNRYSVCVISHRQFIDSCWGGVIDTTKTTVNFYVIGQKSQPEEVKEYIVYMIDDGTEICCLDEQKFDWFDGDCIECSKIIEEVQHPQPEEKIEEDIEERINRRLLEFYEERNRNLQNNPKVLSMITNVVEGSLCGRWIGVDTYRKEEPNHQSTDICLDCDFSGKTSYVAFLEKLIKHYCSKGSNANCRVIDSGFSFETEIQSCEELK